MKRSLFAAVAASCLVSGTAFAGKSMDGGRSGDPSQTQNLQVRQTINTRSTAIAGAAARSSSSSSSRATGGNATATGGNASGGSASSNASGGIGNGGSGGASSSGGNSYSSSARGNTPDAVAPSIVGGNPCTVGASAGLSVAGIGLSGGATTPDHGCETRQRAAILYNMGFTAAAKALLCTDTFYSTAFAQSGEPCAADVRRWVAEGYRQDAQGHWVR